MKPLFLACLFSLLLASGLQAQVQFTTESPRVDDVNDTDVSIQRVELTAQYTIVYMKFQARKEGINGRQLPFQIPMPRGQRGELESTNNIGFQPSSRLYVNQGERSYKFIRAENIPLEVRRKVQPGERVDFVAYFERIDPGYTTFDLFECRDGRGFICFNFWGVHINNPVRKDRYSQRTPRTPVPPKPQQPRYTPRTKPGAGEPPAESTTPPEATPVPVQPKEMPVAVAINGVTRDAKTKEPIVATITYRLISGAEASGDEPADSVRSVSPTGKYKVSIDRRGVYAVTASAKGYFSQSDTLATNRVDVVRDFDLVPIEAGAKITLKNIYFNASKYDLKAESFPELDRLVTVMRANPTMQIRLEGHTDTVGEFDANVELSRNRVNAVKRYLVDKGISAGRIETVGYGPSRPINTNKSLKERPENRRVEMVIVKV
ncbi:OmpA family protein [Spirosoma pollinicola]|uniref:Flagellar motor protein MotB n=1 Tax=Spirosoma pollinicola TaxID=2057025 RepID=A0A2K8Z6I1_9BACT|nr:OmpA family protein [Spirosoma pollinicola]AUD05496.1 flagellar motor protein MotB [Spirosoma pollinicola]